LEGRSEAPAPNGYTDILKKCKTLERHEKMRSCKDSKKFGKLQWSIAYVREKRKS